jgi:prepilin-type processing-associated H-X9-DG protein
MIFYKEKPPAISQILKPKEDTIMKKNKLTITILGCMCVFLIAALILVPAAQAEEKTMKWKIISYFIKMEVFPVPDVENHIVGVLEKRGVAIFEKGETAAYHAWSTFDSIKGQKGSGMGYSNYSFADGSAFMEKNQSTITFAKLSSMKGTGEFIKGTGRFEGIKGKLSFAGKYVTPYTKDKTKGDAYFEVTGTYTLPKK